MRLGCALALVLLAASTAAAQNTLVTLDFQDATPFTNSQWDTGSADDSVFGGAGACGGSNYWNYARTAPAAGNGGYGDRGFVTWTWCDYDTSTAGISSAQSGWYSSASGQYTPMAGWSSSSTFYLRMRLYFTNGLIRHPTAPNSETHHHFKWFITNSGDAGNGSGDDRFMMFLSPGNFDPSGGGSGFGGGCNGNVNTQVCVSVQRNINHYTEAAYALIPVGQWVHLQMAFKVGANGTSFVKLWVDNNTEASPTAQDTALTSGQTWLLTSTTMDAGYQVGQMANEGTATDTDFVIRMMDVQFGLAFDTAWAPSGGGGGGGSGTPSLPARPRANFNVAKLKTWIPHPAAYQEVR